MDFSKHTTRIINRLGESYIYTPAGGDAVEVTGVFAAAPDVTLDVEVFLPTVTCSYADVPAIAEGDTFVIDEITYRVAGKVYERVAGTVRAELEKA